MTPYLKSKAADACCSCLSCVEACPTNAITTKTDRNGFVLPYLDEEKCISCGKCERVCQYSNEQRADGLLGSPCFYAAKSTCKDTVEKSSSGGLFTSICYAFFKSEGIVYGAAYDENFYVKHSSARSLEECEKFRTSKYVISDISGVYAEIKAYLKNGERVLFSGTPCQVAGLYSYLGAKDTKNLICCDLICHGVPSAKTFEDFLSELCEEYNSKIAGVNFKDKQHGWRNPFLKIDFENGESYSRFIWHSSYGKLYHSRFTVMESCNNCKYASMPRVSDITIGDFWGYKRDVHNLGCEDEGVSVAIVNTEKGKRFFENIKENLEFTKLSWEEAKQRHLESSASPPNDALYRYYFKLKKKKLGLSSIQRKIEKREALMNSKAYLLSMRFRDKARSILNKT